MYASVLHYLQAVDKAGGAADSKAIVVAMKAVPTEDLLFGEGYIRADGCKNSSALPGRGKVARGIQVEVGPAETSRDRAWRAGIPS